MNPSGRYQGANHCDVAVIGMAGRFPKADTVNEYWHNLKNGIDCTTEITRWNLKPLYQKTPAPGKIYCKWGGFINDIEMFDPLFFGIPPREAALMDPRQRLFLQTVWETVEDSGYRAETLYNSNTGVFVGAANNDYIFNTRSVTHDILNGLDNTSAGIANRVSHFFGLKGPSTTIETTCSSSLAAIHTACQSIRTGESEMAVAGGVNLLLMKEYYITMCRMKLLSTDRFCRVMDRSANGFIPGEGVAAVLLKPLDRAVMEKDKIYGVIKASGMNHSGHTANILVPSLSAEAELVETVVTRSGIDAQTLSYIELSGAGTVLGDYSEVKALIRAFEKLSPGMTSCRIGSVKPNIGNLEPASGIAGFIKTLLSIRYKTIPATLNFDKPNRFLNWNKVPFVLNDKTNPWPQTKETPIRAGISSFGIGGTNVHMVVEGYVPEPVPSEGNRTCAEIDTDCFYIFTLSARNESGLVNRAKQLYIWLSDHRNDVSMAALSNALNTGRVHFRHRLALVCATRGELMSKLDQFFKNFPYSPGRIFPGVYYSGKLPAPDRPVQKKMKGVMGRIRELEPSQPVRPHYAEEIGTPAVVFNFSSSARGSDNRFTVLETRFYNEIDFYRRIWKTCFNLIPEPIRKPFVRHVLSGASTVEKNEIFSRLYRIMSPYTAALFWKTTGVMPVKISGVESGSCAARAFEKQSGLETAVKAIMAGAAPGEGPPAADGEDLPPSLERIGNELVLHLMPGGLNTYPSFLFTLAEIYQNGIPLQWNLFLPAAPHPEPGLPGYPFEKRRCWVDVTEPPRDGLANDPAPPLSSGELKASPPDLPANDTAARIAELFIRQMIEKHGYRRDEIDLNTPLSNYGVDSIFFLETIQKIELEMGCRIDPSDLADLQTLEQLSDGMADKIDVDPDRETKIPNRFCSTPVASLPGKQTGIAVIGMAGMFPGARDIDIFRANIETGHDAVGILPEDRRHLYEQTRDGTMDRRERGGFKAGFIDGVDRFDGPFFNMHKQAVLNMDPHHRLFLEQAWNTFEHAGYTKKYLKKFRTGVFVGLSSAQEYLHQVLSRQRMNIHGLTGNARSFLSNRISHIFGLNGPSVTIDTACSSSLSAVHFACQSIVAGECDMALAGGVNLLLDASSFTALSKAGLLSTSGCCRVFDQRADGYVRGEGVGAVLLKTLEKARDDGDIIHAVIKASGMNHNGENLNMTVPSLKAQIRLFQDTYEKSGIHPETISYIEAGSTGNPLSDHIEIRALSSVFSRFTKRRQYCRIGSLKPNIGHLEAASGIAGLIKIILSMKQRQLPGLLHFSSENRHIELKRSPFYICAEPGEWHVETTPRRAGLSSFGLGGTNLHLVVEEGPRKDTKPETSSGSGHQVLVLSAKNKAAMKKTACNLNTYLTGHPGSALTDISYTANCCKTHFGNWDFAIAAASKEELAEKLADHRLPLNAGRKKPPGTVVFHFTGRTVPMGFVTTLYNLEPCFKHHMENSLSRLGGLFKHQRSIRTLNTGKNKEEIPFESVPPDLFQLAVRSAISRFMADLNILPARITGSGQGAFAAASFSGMITLSEAGQIVLNRARIIRELNQKGLSLKAVENLIDLKETLPAVKRFEKKMQTIHFKTPKTAVASGIFEAASHNSPDVRYWLSHLLGNDLQPPGQDNGTDEESLVIEVEPAETNPAAPQILSPVMPENKDFRAVFPAFLQDLFNAGLEINWEKFYQNKPVKKIELPTYPFTRQVYWPTH